MPVRVELSPDDKDIHLHADFRYKDLCKTVPGLKWLRAQSLWSMPLSWSGCLALRSTFGADLEIGPRLTEWAVNERSTRIDPAVALRDLAELDDGDEDLFPHQRAGVAFLATAKRALLADEPGLGKALANSEQVLTPSGFVPMGTIKEGDTVVGSNGLPTSVLGVYPQGVRDIYRVTFSDGSKADVDLEHLWTVENARTGYTRTVSTSWMLEQGLRTSDGHRKFRIPMVEAVDCATASPPADPYVLGLIVGDGCVDRFGRTRISTSDSEIVQYMVDVAGLDIRPRAKYDYYLAGFSSVSREAGFLGKTASRKELPPSFLQWSAEHRIALLRGLMDSDGWVSKDGTIVQFTTVSTTLVHQVKLLVSSLGGTAKLTTKPTPKGGNYPVLNLTINTKLNPFLLSRKADLWVARDKYPATRYVDSIVFVREEEATCIEVSADDHLFVMNDYIVTHNTAQAIRALKRVHETDGGAFPALVVCPNTLKLNWKREFEKWWPEVDVLVISGTAAQRRKQFDLILNPKAGDPVPSVIVCNWESLRTHSRLGSYGSVALTRCFECGGEDPSISVTRCEAHVRELNQIDFRAVIADEIHRSKDPKSKQTRALWAATGDAEYRFALTGTPIANDVVDLWSILHWLDPNEWPSKTRWIDRMINTMMNAFGGLLVLGVKPHMEQEFFSALNPRMRRMLKKVVLPWLPPVLYSRRDVEMSAKQKKAYKQMKDFMIAELDDGYLTADSPLTRTTRLVQLASAYGEIVVDDTTGETKMLLSEPSCKVDSLMDDISKGDFGDSSVAVSAVSRQLIDLLSAKMTKEGIAHGLVTGTTSPEDRQKAVDDFQAGRIKWILFTAQAGGVGITLTAAKYLVRLQRPWSLVDDTQVNDRVHRIGSEIHDHIMILDYVTTDTIEEAVAEALYAKGENFEEIVKDKEKLRKLLESH